MSSIELYALWQSHAHDAIRAFSGTAAAAQRQLGVAVVLPDMPIEYEELVALEDAGLVLIEVPAAMEHTDSDELKRYLGEQLKNVKSSFGSADTPVSAYGRTPNPDEYGPSTPTNDPAAAEQFLHNLNAAGSNDVW